MPGDFAEGPLERILHSATGRLRLEAAERMAGILDGERSEAHGRSRYQGAERVWQCRHR